MGVRVRLFAALREAAGTAELQMDPGPLSALLDELCGRFGEPFTSRLSFASVLVNGDPAARAADMLVPDGGEVALLPPVSGGAPAGPMRPGP